MINNRKAVKNEIYNQIAAILASKAEEAEAAIASVRESRNNDTKSSAGDKYETGRAMMQMEIDNSELQLSKAHQQQLELLKIDINRTYTKVQPGALVITNHENYFISIAMGKIIVDGLNYYAISLASPIGMLLQNKIAGDTAEFQGRNLIIKEVE